MLAEKQLKKNVTTICRNASKEKYNLTKSELLKWEREFTEFAKVYMMENFGVQLRIPIKVSNRLNQRADIFVTAIITRFTKCVKVLLKLLFLLT